jgi:hypothetical protein
VLLLLAKATNRLLCLAFAAGLPGLFGRSMLLYADQVTSRGAWPPVHPQIVDRNCEKVYSMACTPGAVAAHCVAAATRLLIFGPALALTHALRFYSHSLADIKGSVPEEYL